MTTFEISVEGLKGIEQALARVEDIGEIITPVMMEWGMKEAQGLRGKPYPPERPNQKYRRTGRLANSWSASKTGKLEVTIKNSAQFRGKHYANYVVGERQAWMHAGRWWQGFKVVEEHLPSLVGAMEDEIAKVFDE